MLLAFDTSTAAVTVALHAGGEVVAAESAVDGRRHGELLAVFIERVLHAARAAPADLSCVAVGTGPGPYTGLRAGLVTARVLGSALGVRVDGICSLDVIAADVAAAGRDEPFAVATDARRREVYWARYDARGARAGGPGVGKPGDRPGELTGGLAVAGEGAALYPQLGAPLEPRYPAAERLALMAAARQAAGAEPGPAQPLYLRRPDAREPGPPKRVTPAAAGR